MVNEVRLDRRAAGGLTTLQLTALPLLAFAVYLAALAMHLPRWLSVDVNWNSDAISYNILAETVAHGVHGPIWLANAPWYHVLLLDTLTAPLPGHRALWLLWPAAFYVAAVVVLAVTTARLAGRWAGLMTGVLCLAPTAPTLYPIITQAYHALTAIDSMLLAALLVAVTRARRLDWQLSLAGVTLGLFSGLNAASDGLGILIALAPFAAVAGTLAVVWRDRASLRLVLSATVVTATAVVA